MHVTQSMKQSQLETRGGLIYAKCEIIATTRCSIA